MTSTLSWVEPLRFTGKRSWRWEGVAEWSGRRFSVSIWYDSTEPTRAGSSPDARLLRPIERRLALAFELLVEKQADFVAQFSKLQKKKWPKAKPVTIASLGEPIVSLPNGQKRSRIDFDFRACNVFGKHLFPHVTSEDNRLSLCLESELDAKHVPLVPYDEEKHSVPQPKPKPEVKIPPLPARSSWKPAKVAWAKALRYGNEEWRGKVRFRGKTIDVTSLDEKSPNELTLGFALGTFDALLAAASAELAHLHATAGWGTRTHTPKEVRSKIKLRSISLNKKRWTLSFSDGGLFAGHRIHVWPEGKKAEIDLVG